MSLTPGQDTFTIDRLRQVWRQDRLVPGSYLRSRAENFQYDSNHNLKHNQSFCLRLHASVQDPKDHFARIDEAFAPVMIGRFIQNVSEDTVRNFFFDLVWECFNSEFFHSFSLGADCQ